MRVWFATQDHHSHGCLAKLRYSHSIRFSTSESFAYIREARNLEKFNSAELQNKTFIKAVVSLYFSYTDCFWIVNFRNEALYLNVASPSRAVGATCVGTRYAYARVWFNVLASWVYVEVWFLCVWQNRVKQKCRFMVTFGKPINWIVAPARTNCNRIDLFNCLSMKCWFRIILQIHSTVLGGQLNNFYSEQSFRGWDLPVWVNRFEWGEGYFCPKEQKIMSSMSQLKND